MLPENLSLPRWCRGLCCYYLTDAVCLPRPLSLSLSCSLSVNGVPNANKAANMYVPNEILFRAPWGFLKWKLVPFMSVSGPGVLQICLPCQKLVSKQFFYELLCDLWQTFWVRIRVQILTEAMTALFPSYTDAIAEVHTCSCASQTIILLLRICMYMLIQLASNLTNYLKSHAELSMRAYPILKCAKYVLRCPLSWIRLDLTSHVLVRPIRDCAIHA